MGQALTEALGIEPDVIFDIAVEANRPDAWSMAGVARDLAARLGLPFAIPATVATLVRAVGQASSGEGSTPGLGRPGSTGRRRSDTLTLAGPGRRSRAVPPVHRPGRSPASGWPRRPGGWPAG